MHPLFRIVLKSLQQVPDQSAVVVLCDCSPVVVGVQKAPDTNPDHGYAACFPMAPRVCGKFQEKPAAIV